MVRTFQLPKALAKMTVLDNMKLAATDQGGERIFAALVRPLWRARERQVEARARELLAGSGSWPSRVTSRGRCQADSASCWSSAGR